jgi:hypothetical protein
MMEMKRSFFVALLVSLLCAQPSLSMSSSHFQINWDNVNAGGDDFASSASYQLNDSLGQIADGTSTGVLYSLRAGYRAAEASSEVLGLTLHAQETATQVTYSSFSRVGNTVTVSSAGYLSVGDYVAVVENAGFSQRLAVGRVTGIVANVVTVDAWGGDAYSISPSPSGGDDFVYRLGGAAIAFGALTAGNQNTSVAAVSVGSTALNGYAVYIQGDGLLRSGLHTVASVADGAVSVGSEEYGVSVTGTRAFAAGVDTAVTSSQRIIEQSSAPSSATGDRVGMVFKLSTTAATTPGTYEQAIFYTLTANY